MVLSQEDNSSPALMSRAFNFYLATVSILETTQKKPHAQKFADREREASGKK